MYLQWNLSMIMISKLLLLICIYNVFVIKLFKAFSCVLSVSGCVCVYVCVNLFFNIFLYLRDQMIINLILQ